jgi:predicted Rdx family selenoprotein
MLNIVIPYKRGDDYANDAVNLEIELLNQFEPHIEQITLVPNDEKSFVVEVNGQQIYSLQESGSEYDSQKVLGMIQYLIHRGHL